ncbi:MAG: hypothetical protein K5829_03670, partial [Treponema sp.]|nr:hypothetical protein [Treponema sp.]
SLLHEVHISFLTLRRPAGMRELSRELQAQNLQPATYLFYYTKHYFSIFSIKVHFFYLLLNSPATPFLPKKTKKITNPHHHHLQTNNKYF